jgi:hypothetical protein
MVGVATTKMSSKGQKDTVILKAIPAPTLADFDELVSEARRQARQAGMKRSDVVAAIREVRGAK